MGKAQKLGGVKWRKTINTHNFHNTTTMAKTPKDIKKYQSNYSESALWDKLAEFGKKAGAKIVYKVLILYYVLDSPHLSLEDKLLIYGALGYFILPADLIPDIAPVIGYTDDFAAVCYVFNIIESNVTPEIEQKALRKLRNWFGNIDKEDLI